MYKVLKRSMCLNLVAACLAGGLGGCGSSSSSGSKSDGAAGGPGSGGTGGGAGGTSPDGGTLSLYDRLGGKAGLEMFVKTVVETKILTDADLKTFFFNQVA